MTLIVGEKKEVRNGGIPRAPGNPVDPESRKKLQKITRNTNLTKMTVNTKVENKIIHDLHPLQHHLLLPVLEKKRKVRRKEKKTLKLIMNSKNIQALQELVDHEEPSFELEAEEEPEEFLLGQILVQTTQILLFKRDRRKRNGIQNIPQRARSTSCMMTEMMVWIIGPKEEEVVVLFNVAEGALTSKNQVAVQNGLTTNTKGTGLLKMKKRPWKIMKKRRTDAKKKRNRKSEVRLQQRAELAPTIFLPDFCFQIRM